MSGAYETNYNGDGKTFLMSPFEIAIERHVGRTLTAPSWEGSW
jgi:hypothetical protein